jgi:hypothetical protein
MESSDIISLLVRFKNVVLEGVPGTGKTYAAEQIRAEWNAATTRVLSTVQTITMHPSTAYEDIIEGLRPETVPTASFLDPLPPATGPSTFAVTNGIFVNACITAVKEPAADHLILLDELNRANVPKVLGDLLLVVEDTKRVRFDNSLGEWEARRTTTQLAYSARNFWVPDNLYVLATMNTSDRSVAPLDAALRRRFAFVRLDPMSRIEVLALIREKFGDDVCELCEPSVSLWDALNRHVLEPCLGPDALLGHSYLISMAAACSKELAIPPDTTGWEDLFRELQRGETTSGNVIHDAFWHETGKMTSSARNQLDLSMRGASDATRGSLHYFFDPASDTETRAVDLFFEGEWYRANEITLYSGERSNGTWRIKLNGKSDADDTKSLTAKAETDFVQHVLVFLAIDNGYELRAYDKSVLPAFGSISRADRTVGGPSSRAYGKFVGLGLRSDPIGATWRYTVLPQLIETVVSNGAEDLLDPNRRPSWFESHGGLQDVEASASGILDALESHLATFGIEVRVEGTGLGRGPVVADLAPPARLVAKSSVEPSEAIDLDDVLREGEEGSAA